MTYRLVVARSAARAPQQSLPEPVAAAALQFINGALLDNPMRVGKPLHAPLEGRRSARRGQYRIIYGVEETEQTVTVFLVSHRRDAYR